MTGQNPILAKRGAAGSLPLTGPRAYLLAALGVGIAWTLRWWVDPLWGERQPYGIFFLAELALVYFVGARPFVLAVLASVLLGDWFFVAPRHSLWIADRVNQVNTGCFVLLSVALLFLARRVRRAKEEREGLLRELQEALANVKALSGLLPICAQCKNIRDDKGYWNQIEIYIRERSEAQFTHGICPECARKLYPQIFETSDDLGPLEVQR